MKKTTKVAKKKPDANPKAAKKEKTGCIRVASFEVSGLQKDDWKRWRELGDVTRSIINATWQSWLVWHFQNGTAAKMSEHFRLFAEWNTGDPKTRGEKPKWPVSAVPKECAKATYDAVAALFPQIETSARELCRNAVIQKIGQLKAASGNLPGWVSIIFCRQSLPSTVRANPIPFSKKNSEIEPPPPGDKDGQWKLHVKLSRIAPANGKKMGTAAKETVNLWSRGRKAAGQVAILKKIASGEYEFCGSSMVYADSKNKWFAKICYRMPATEKADLDVNRTAILRPVSATAAWPHPWKLRVPGSNRAPGGDGRYIAGVRRKIIAERMSRQRGYRNAGSANKGHGRDRALQPIWHLQNRWKDFVKTCNYSVARDVVNQCIERQCGRLVYIQPTAHKDGKFLSCAGKDDRDREASGWDWYQVGSRLATLCDEFGIEFVCKKSRECSSLKKDKDAA